MRTSVPKQFTIGESLKWTKSFDDYPAGDGWTLAYFFRGPGVGIDVNGTADGDDFLLTVPADDTDGMTAGKYFYQAFATLDSERILVDSGSVDVLEAFGDTDTTYDGRSQVKQTLDAIDARLKGDVTKGVLEYTIGDRQLKRYTLKELADLRKVYANLYAQELQAEKANKGGGLFRNHYVRFRRPR